MFKERRIVRWPMPSNLSLELRKLNEFSVNIYLALLSSLFPASNMALDCLPVSAFCMLPKAPSSHAGFILSFTAGRLVAVLAKYKKVAIPSTKPMLASHSVNDSTWSFQSFILLQIQPPDSVFLRVPLLLGNACSLARGDHGENISEEAETERSVLSWTPYLYTQASILAKVRLEVKRKPPDTDDHPIRTYDGRPPSATPQFQPHPSISMRTKI